MSRSSSATLSRFPENGPTSFCLPGCPLMYTQLLLPLGHRERCAVIAQIPEKLFSLLPVVRPEVGVLDPARLYNDSAFKFLRINPMRWFFFFSVSFLFFFSPTIVSQELIQADWLHISYGTEYALELVLLPPFLTPWATDAGHHA